MNKSILIGSLGSLRFEKGIYSYVGSAQRGLEARLRRHLKKVKKLFWHIDYLLSQKDARIVEVWIGKGRGECQVARRIYTATSPRAIKRFGSSDCGCQGHLFYLKNETAKVKSLLRKFGFEQRSSHLTANPPLLEVASSE